MADKETRLAECIFDITQEADYYFRCVRNRPDSRDLFAHILSWAQEFEKSGYEDYLPEIAEFAEEKLGNEYPHIRRNSYPTISINARSRSEAWEKAVGLFPSLHIKLDKRASEGAGYPIYSSDGSWISDLGDAFEVNVQDGRRIQTMRINICCKPPDTRKVKVREKANWTPDTVRKACISHGLYTKGAIAEYNKMLKYVRDHRSDTNALYCVSKDIAAHSDEQTVENVMYILSNEAVRRTYTIE